jgi:hypothetical protein
VSSALNSATIGTVIATSSLLILHTSVNLQSSYKAAKPFKPNIMKSMPAGRIAITLSYVFSTLLVLAACKKDRHQPATARGSLYNDAGECIPSIVHGNWFNGSTLDPDSNYVELHVVVTRTGSYDITTDKLDGVTFSASGSFTDTGLNIVKLQPAGAFTNDGAITFPVRFDSTICQFSINIQDSSTAALPNNGFQVTIEGHTYRGLGAFQFFPIPTTGGSVLQGTYDGRVGLATGDTAIQLNFASAPGPFGIDTSAYVGGMILYLVGTGRRYYESAFNGITIQFSASSPQIASFSGTAKDTVGNVVPIMNGKIKYWPY